MDDEDTLNRRQRLKKWLVARTHLEYALAVLAIGLLALVVVLLVALNGESAPLETVWGNVAEWAGVVVTFFGFIGAIAALRIQDKSVGIQHKQWETRVLEKSAADLARQRDAAAQVTQQQEQETQRLLVEHEKYARSVDLKVTAEHQRPAPGHARSSDGQLVLTVRAYFRRWNKPVPLGPYQDARLIVPDQTQLNGMKETISRVQEAKVGASGFHSDLIWRVTGEGLFSGDDIEARRWLVPKVGVEFTDPKGIRWRINGDRTLELSIGDSLGMTQN